MEQKLANTWVVCNDEETRFLTDYDCSFLTTTSILEAKKYPDDVDAMEARDKANNVNCTILGMHWKVQRIEIGTYQIVVHEKEKRS